MPVAGWLLYAAGAALAYWFWRRSRGSSFAELVERSRAEHHLVAEVFRAHPQGGRWSEFERWIGEERRKPSR